MTKKQVMKNQRRRFDLFSLAMAVFAIFLILSKPAYWAEKASAQNELGLLEIKQVLIHRDLWENRQIFSSNIQRKFQLYDFEYSVFFEDPKAFKGQRIWIRVGTHANYFLDRLDSATVKFVLNSNLQGIGYFAEYMKGSKVLVIRKLNE